MYLSSCHPSFPITARLAFDMVFPDLYLDLAAEVCYLGSDKELQKESNETTN